MWVEAILTRDDLEKVMNDFCPLSIQLGESGNIQLSDPRGFELVPAVGLRMTVTVEVHWPVLGIALPVSVRSATLEVRPEILEKSAGHCLTFKLHLDDVDISILPEIIDRGIVDLVNGELASKHVELSWGFTKTLSHVFELPDAMASARAIDLSAQWGSVKITSEALVLAVSFEARVEPRGAEPSAPRAILARAAPVPDVEPRTPVPTAARSLWRRSPTSLALVGGGALLAGMSVFALIFSRQRPRGLLDRVRELQWT